MAISYFCRLAARGSECTKYAIERTNAKGLPAYDDSTGHG